LKNPEKDLLIGSIEEIARVQFLKNLQCIRCHFNTLSAFLMKTQDSLRLSMWSLLHWQEVSIHLSKILRKITNISSLSLHSKKTRSYYQLYQRLGIITKKVKKSIRIQY